MHSLHAYFLRRGDFNAPIVYEVDRSRDGTASRAGAWSRSSTASRSSTCRRRSRCRRRVSITRSRCRRCRRRKSCRDRPSRRGAARTHAGDAAALLAIKPRPFEFRMVQPFNPLSRARRAPARQIWMRAVGPSTRRRDAASLPARVRFRFLAARHRDVAARLLVPEQQA